MRECVSNMKSIERKVNAFLRALPAEKRPEMANRSRAQSVAIATTGVFEVTDREGHVEHMRAETVMSWVC